MKFFKKNKKSGASVVVLAPHLLVVSVRFLAGMGALSLALTKELEMVGFGLFALCLIVGIQIDRMRRVSVWASRIQPYLAALAFAYAVADFFYLSQSFLLAIAHFLLAIQALRLLALRTARENLGSILLSSLMMISASTLAVEWTYILMIILFLPSVIWTLMLHNLSAETEAKLKHDQDMPNQEWRVDDRSQAWRQVIPSVRQSAIVAFFVAMLCCAFIFAIFPRFNFRGFKGQFLQPVHKTGFTNQVDLDGNGKIFEDDSIAMRVEIHESQRQQWSGYLRGNTLDDFDGVKWRRSRNFQETPVYNPGPTLKLPWAESDFGPLLHQTIFLESMDSSILFTAPHPVQIKIERSVLLVGDDQSVLRPSRDTWRTRYEVDSLVSFSGHKRVRRGSWSRFSFDWIDRPRSLRLPSTGHYGEIKRLTQKITASQKQLMGKAQALSDYLRANYRYSLSAPSVADENPVAEFLFKTKQGHCEFFASALCLMLRLEGIPSRIVTGFYSHEWNSRGHYVVVRMKHAHAWVEAYIDGQGWVLLDPSPREFGESSSAASLGNRMREFMDYLNLQWNYYVLSYDMERQVELFTTFGQRSQEWSSRFERFRKKFDIALSFSWKPKAPDAPGRPKGPSPFASKLFFAVVFLFVFGLLAWGSLALITWIKQDQAERVYKRLATFLQKKAGIQISRQTLGETVQQNEQKLGMAFSSVWFLTQCYYQMRFDPQFKVSKSILQNINQAFKKVHEQFMN